MFVGAHEMVVVNVVDMSGRELEAYTQGDGQQVDQWSGVVVQPDTT